MAFRQPKVLVADDSNAVHQLFRDALPADYATDVTHAHNGIECLATTPVTDLMAGAKKAAMLELENANLVHLGNAA